LIGDKPEIHGDALHRCLENIDFVVELDFVWFVVEQQETVECHQEEDKENLMDRT